MVHLFDVLKHQTSFFQMLSIKIETISACTVLYEWSLILAYRSFCFLADAEGREDLSLLSWTLIHLDLFGVELNGPRMCLVH